MQSSKRDAGSGIDAALSNGRDVSFLPKPFTNRQLATKVRQVLDQG